MGVGSDSISVGDASSLGMVTKINYKPPLIIVRPYCKIFNSIYSICYRGATTDTAINIQGKILTGQN